MLIIGKDKYRKYKCKCGFKNKYYGAYATNEFPEGLSCQLFDVETLKCERCRNEFYKIRWSR